MGGQERWHRVKKVLSAWQERKVREGRDQGLEYNCEILDAFTVLKNKVHV